MGGPCSPLGIASLGTMIKKAAANPVRTAHSLMIRNEDWLLVSTEKAPASGQRLPAARAMLSATSDGMVRFPCAGFPKESLATFQKKRSIRETSSSLQGTRKSRQKMPKILMIPTRSPEGHTLRVKMERMPT